MLLSNEVLAIESLSASSMHYASNLIASTTLSDLSSEHLIRRTTTSVNTQAGFVAAIATVATISLTANIYLTSTISISGVTSLSIIGNGYFVDGGSAYTCFSIASGSAVSMSNIVIQNGYTVNINFIPLN